MDQLILSWPQVLAQESHGEILFTTLAPRINVFNNLVHLKTQNNLR